MGRNSIPKLYEWRDGVRYRFRLQSGGSVFSPESGDFVIYERQTMDGVEVLATAWADGLSELMAAMFESGFEKGKSEGISEAKADIRKALGVHP
jgi:hypothetical protein